MYPPQGLARRFKRMKKALDTFFEKIIDEHEQEINIPDDQKPHRDFVDVLVSLLNNPMNPHDEDQTFII
ncbi:hypothetical protein PTKIN_Ptkin17bG0030000 [Pterospermum kingtungense]